MKKNRTRNVNKVATEKLGRMKQGVAKIRTQTNYQRVELRVKEKLLQQETILIRDMTDSSKATTKETIYVNTSATNPSMVRKKALARINQIAQMSTQTTVTGGERNPHRIETPIRNASANLNNPSIPFNKTRLTTIKRRLPVVPPMQLNCSSNILFNDSSIPTEITASSINVTQQR